MMMAGFEGFAMSLFSLCLFLQFSLLAFLMQIVTKAVTKWMYYLPSASSRSFSSFFFLSFLSLAMALDSVVDVAVTGAAATGA